MRTYELERIHKFLLEKHHLTETSKINNIIQITEDLCGLHSTNLATSYLSLFARTKQFTKLDLERELYINKNLGRIRCMRRTLFIQTINMIPIVHTATFKIIEKSFEKYMEFYKISVSDYQEISNKIIALLKGKEFSTSEIRKELSSQASISQIIQLMGDYGLLIRGRPIKNWKDRRNKYVLFKEYFPNIDLNKFNEEEAIKLLVEKYVKTYGPVTETDISWWTGLTKTKIREALNCISSQIKNVKISNVKGNYILSESDIESLNLFTSSEKPALNLLPELDPYPMGYKERDRYINASYYPYAFDRSGNNTASIILNGCIIGVWDTEEKPEATIKIHLFHPIEEDLRDELFSKAKLTGTFIFDENVKVIECKSMIPLTERNAGGFMSPLKNC